LAVEVSESLAQFLAEPYAAVVGTLRKNGTVQLNPVWFEYRDGAIWLNSWRGSDWARHIEQQGGATVLAVDPNNMYRFAEIQVRLLESRDEGGREHIEALSYRYTGGPYRATDQQRFILKLEPTDVRSRV
jgi:general stress protein 26